MYSRTSTFGRLASCLAGSMAALLLFVGCIGPQSIRLTRTQYNDAVKLTGEQEMLLNLVRLRYDESPAFLSLNSVTSQFALTPEVGFSAEADGNKPRYFGTGNLSWEDRPTLSYTPQSNSNFIRSQLTPVDVENLALLARLGWDNERVFRLIIKQINGVENSVLAGGPVPDTVPAFAEFHEVARLANYMRDQNISDITVDERPVVVATAAGINTLAGDQIVRAAESQLSLEADNEDIKVTKLDRQLIAKFNPQFSFSPEAQQFRELLNLRRDLSEYPIVPSSAGHFEALNSPNGIDEVRITTRAPMEIMFYLSKGVHVPEEHLQCGLAATTVNFDGTPFSWHQVVGDLIQIRCCKRKPKSRLSVKYRGYWFYIDDCDRVSKRTMLMLTAILEISQIESESDKPLLTLPL